MSYFRNLFRLLVVATAAIALGACATRADHHDHDHGHDHHHEGHDHGHDHDHHGHGTDGRLLVVTDHGTIAVLDAHDGDVEAIFAHALPDGALAAYAGPSGEFGYVVHRDASIVVVVDSGQILEEHDGHEDLEFGPIGLIGEIRVGSLPTHFTTMAGRVGFYNDESGDITILDEGALRSEIVPRLVPARADHGAPILLSDRMIVGYVGETFVEIMDYTGTVLQTIPNVSRAHGQARVGRFSAIGALEGVLVVTQTGSSFDARMVANPSGTPEGVRTGTLAAHPRLPHFVGNLGQGLVKVDPAAHTSVAVALPAAPWRFGIDRSGHYVVVLGQDGVVYVLDSESFDLVGSVAAVAARDPDAPRGTPIPSLTLGRRIAFVSDPATNHIYEIHLDDVEIEAEFHVELDGTITAIALMVTDGIIH
ncbi:MAG: hypothetical protein EA382_14700 [Spirochaetaceae bacterium]|nr:MAG: hypothetical protein EA382_14700 [Spirochaetaceae bacterium]